MVFFNTEHLSVTKLEEYSNLWGKLERLDVCFAPNCIPLWQSPHFKVQKIVLCPLTKHIQKHLLCQDVRLYLVPT